MLVFWFFVLWVWGFLVLFVFVGSWFGFLLWVFGVFLVVFWWIWGFLCFGVFFRLVFCPFVFVVLEVFGLVLWIGFTLVFFNCFHGLGDFCVGFFVC